MPYCIIVSLTLKLLMSILFIIVIVCVSVHQAGDDDPIQKAVGDHATVLTQVLLINSFFCIFNLPVP